MQTALYIGRDIVEKRIKEALAILKEKGTRPEDVAHGMEVSYNTVKNWLAGRRVPKIPTVRRMEQLYGMKIL